ncbi:MAG: 16S rRNA (cytidine(1402)-2'-O)-methyltransferase [Bacteroidia bacterium]|nr:16S rRNA (cytidine(1402)-2'-O)-methyltransferase [Bacteroidia bacterium]MCX7652841.1 16S rRNA (cytidine(1402)-2'-O)-methyltransferase [Bacteroidia bacterium]MDW8415949.1 16S rRNA (cytidine(1402)-2'-O)-methyltransferase [Bacteroidia bacterium]
MKGLWVIPTPIGNLEDITLRALEALKGMDALWCEDTRNARKLLSHYSISGKPLRALHVGNEHKAIQRLFAEATAKGWKVGLLTDGGMPGISDPGFLPIREAHRRFIPVHVLPGPSAFLTALIASGLPMERFVFEGFFPRKAQKSYLQPLCSEERTLIWYESPHRLVKTLGLLREVFGDQRWACVARELTKVYEEVRRGTLAQLHDYYAAHTPRGEVVLVVAGATYSEALA